MWTGWRVAVTIAVVVGVCACDTRFLSPSESLSKHLLPVRSLEASPWSLKLRPATSTGKDYSIPTKTERGATPSGSPPTTIPLGRASVVVQRRWTSAKASGNGPLRQGIFSVINAAVEFNSSNDASAYANGLSATTGAQSQPVPGVAGAVVYVSVLPPPVAPLSRLAVVVVSRGRDVFTVVITGDGDRPNAEDATALAELQTKSAA